MSRRDGRMYVASFVSKIAETDHGFSINFDRGPIAGYCTVFWTKTEARRVYGRKVDLKEIRLAAVDPEPTITDQGVQKE